MQYILSYKVEHVTDKDIEKGNTLAIYNEKAAWYTDSILFRYLVEFVFVEIFTSDFLSKKYASEQYLFDKIKYQLYPSISSIMLHVSVMVL